MSTLTRAAISGALARGFLQAVVTCDEPTLRRLLDDEVWLRAMLVRETVERHDAERAIELFRSWFGTAHAIEVLHASTRPAATREAVTYRLRLRPHWAPGVWHVIEQTGYLRVRHGRIRRIDLVCTGFVPEPELLAHGDGERHERSCQRARSS